MDIRNTGDADRLLEAARYDRAFGWIKQSRSVAYGIHGMVATSHPVAVQVALDVLKAGGNAVDAAVACNATLGVVEPFSCGIGGDLIAIVASEASVTGLNASGKSPRELSRETFSSRGLGAIPERSALAWSVPGCVSGWVSLLEKHGTWTLARALQPAVRIAEEGFVVTPTAAGYWNGLLDEVKECRGFCDVFCLDGGRAPRAGEVVKNPALAKALALIAREGRRGFYEGSIADEIVKVGAEEGGCLQMEDLARHGDEWVEPVSIAYRGHQVWEMPPNSSGIAALQMLNILKGYDLSEYGPSHAEYLHLLIEAKKLAFADRAKFYADPAASNIPVEQLLSDEYANAQRGRINVHKASEVVSPGDPEGLRHGDTVYLTIVDRNGMAVSLIQSIFRGFGSGIAISKYGFCMQNRGCLFSLDPSHYNFVEGGKRPFNTIMPAMVTKDAKPVLSFGVMGGDMQPQGQVQVLMNMFEFGLDIQGAGDVARLRHLGVASPTGIHDECLGTVVLESDVPLETVRCLRGKGHVVQVGARGEHMGGYQAIYLDHEIGVLQGATEVRNDGLALGY